MSCEQNLAVSEGVAAKTDQNILAIPRVAVYIDPLAVLRNSHRLADADSRVFTRLIWICVSAAAGRFWRLVTVAASYSIGYCRNAYRGQTVSAQTFPANSGKDNLAYPVYLF